VANICLRMGGMKVEPAPAAATCPDSLVSVQWATMHALRPQLERAVRRQGLTAEQAQDVVSEAFLRAAGAPGLESARLHAWLHVVASRLAVDEHRRRPTPRLEQRLLAQALPEPDVADRIVDRAEAAWVAGLVQALPPRQRSVIEHRSSGVAPAEVAETLGLSYKTVESLTSRARRSIRDAVTSAAGAAAALLASVAAAFRRGGRLSPPATAASVLAAAAVVAYGAPPQAPTPLERPSVPSTHRTQFPQELASALEPQIQRARRLGGEGGRPRRLPKHGGAGIPKGGSTVVALPAHRLPLVQHDEVELRRDSGHDSLLASAADCLRAGVVVTPAHIGCPSPTPDSPMATP
jgi:RNA polymerase sigma factor (sigma-70 family)